VEYPEVSADKLLLRVSEAAEALSLSKSKTYEAIAQGVIPSMRIAGVLRVPADALKEMIRRQTRPGIAGADTGDDADAA
jgi:excisionase family DNA binding protein